MESDVLEDQLKDFVLNKDIAFESRFESDFSNSVTKFGLATTYVNAFRQSYDDLMSFDIGNPPTPESRLREEKFLKKVLLEELTSDLETCNDPAERAKLCSKISDTKSELALLKKTTS